MQLPQDDFVFGMKSFGDCEGARDSTLLPELYSSNTLFPVTMVWQEHVPNPDVKPGPDYVSMNKLAAMRYSVKTFLLLLLTIHPCSGLTDSKSLRSFRSQNPLTIKRRDTYSRNSSFTTKLQNKIFGMESCYRSAEKIRNYG